MKNNQNQTKASYLSNTANNTFSLQTQLTYMKGKQSILLSRKYPQTKIPRVNNNISSGANLANELEAITYCLSDVLTQTAVPNLLYDISSPSNIAALPTNGGNIILLFNIYYLLSTSLPHPLQLNKIPKDTHRNNRPNQQSAEPNFIF